jgi:hypothetical protein
MHAPDFVLRCEADSPPLIVLGWINAERALAAKWKI